MDVFAQDLRASWRALRQSPRFTAIALVTIALGTGANATVFSFVNALLLRPAAGVADPSSLVAIFTSDYSSSPYGETSYPDYLSLKTATSVFDDITAFDDDVVAVVRAGDVTERIRVTAVAGAFFDVLGLRATTGRLLTRDDLRPDAPPVMVIGHDLWRRMFGGSPAALGRTLIVNGVGYTIVGIAPESFTGLDLGRPADGWVPLEPPPETPTERQNRNYNVVARLRDGASLRDAQTQVQTIAERLAQLYPESNLGTLQAPDKARPMFALIHTRIDPRFRADVVTLGGVILAASSFVLLIACANVASLLLARATARGREIGIRLAIGASRGRVLRQMLTESLVIGIAGGGAGLLVTLWTSDALPSFFPPEQARLLDASIDARVLLFTLTASVASGLLFGIVPALQASRSSAFGQLHGATVRVVDSRSGVQMRRTLVIAQVALAVVLVVCAALLARSVANALDDDLGFSTREAVLASIELPAGVSAADGMRYYDAAVARVAQLPGVAQASLVRTPPLAGGARRRFTFDGYVFRPGEDRELNFNIVSETFFDTVGIPVVAGRSFERADAGRARVVVINEALANRYFAGDAVGRQLSDSAGRDLEVVGVVETGKYLSVQEPPLPMVYYPLSQEYTPRMTLVAAAPGGADAFADTVRRALREVDRSVAVFRLTTLAAHIDEALVAERLTAALVAVCGGLALFLAVVGVYGVIAYGVVRRSREIGVRVALGAQPMHVVRLVLGEGVVITGIGVTLGLAGAAAAAQGLASMLYGLSLADAAFYALIASAAAALAMLAACAPARRALRLDPVAVLRQE